MISDVLDPDTWVRVVAVLERSRRLGLDPAEQLHRFELLWTPEREHRLRVDTMRFILNEMTTWRPDEMLRVKFNPSHTASPADMYACIAAWIEQHIAYARNQHDSS